MIGFVIFILTQRFETVSVSQYDSSFKMDSKGYDYTTPKIAALRVCNELYYEDGFRDDIINYDKTAVCFTPTATPPFYILRTRIMFGGSALDTVEYVALCRDSAGLPDTTPAGIYQKIDSVETLPTGYYLQQWTWIEFDTSLTRIEDSRDLWIVVKHHFLEPPGVLVDNTEGDFTPRTWVYRDDLGYWMHPVAYQALIRLTLGTQPYLSDDVSPVFMRMSATGAKVGDTVTMTATLRNFGDFIYDYPVHLFVNQDNFIDTSFVSFHLPYYYNYSLSTDETCSFFWAPSQYETKYRINIVSALWLDTIFSNDTITGFIETYGLGELGYDDFSPEAYYVVSNPNGPNDCFAVKLFPYYQSPYYLTRLRIYVDSATSLNLVKICPDSNGVPNLNASYFIQNNLVADTAPGWIDVSFNPVAVNDLEPIWLVIDFIPGSYGPGIGADGTFPYGYSYWSRDLVNWYQWAPHNWMMRVFHSQSPGVEEIALRSTSNASHLQIYPNPTKKEYNIRYIVPQKAKVSISILDVTGKLIKGIVNMNQNAGFHLKTLDMTALPQGIYFIRLMVAGRSETKKIIFIK